MRIHIARTCLCTRARTLFWSAVNGREKMPFPLLLRFVIFFYLFRRLVFFFAVAAFIISTLILLCKICCKNFLNGFIYVSKLKDYEINSNLSVFNNLCIICEGKKHSNIEISSLKMDITTQFFSLFFA